MVMARVAERPLAGVVGLVLPRVRQPEGLAAVWAAPRTQDERLAEAVNLFEALQVQVVHAETVTLNRITPATLLGGGVVERLAEVVKAQQLAVLMVDSVLSPRQQRGLEVALNCKVMDRTGVILELFAARARTRAGQLQVELAQLTYQQGRLVRAWSHLERQRGGMGKTGGPGERQLEIDRRLIRARLAMLKQELAEVVQTRGLQRMARQRAATPTVALVGYTNAGKSTLFNALVQAGTLVADALFATLDPLMRRLSLPSGQDIVLIDTVGFVADLPHELVEAFKATLEEVVMADLLLHVQDASSPEMAAQADDVRNVLQQIGAADKRMIQVYNKIDRIADPKLRPMGGGAVQTISVSAVTGKGIPALLAAIQQRLQAEWAELVVKVPAGDGRRLAWLAAHGTLVKQVLKGEVWHLTVRLPQADVGAWQKLVKA
jgi:GTPase